MTAGRSAWPVAAAVAAWVSGAAAGADEPARAFDCVLEPRAVVELGSAEEGILKEVLVERGDRVRRDQVLARLDAELEVYGEKLARLRAESDAATRSASEQLEFRRQELERLKALRERQAVADKEYLQAVSEHKLALLALESTKTDREFARIDQQRSEALVERRTIRSPIDAVVVEATMSPGEYVHKTATVMTLAALDPLHVEVFVPVAHIRELELGGRAEVLPEEPVGGRYEATVAVIDRVFDAASRTVGVRLDLPNPDFALPAGVRCKVRFSDGSH